MNSAFISFVDSVTLCPKLPESVNKSVYLMLEVPWVTADACKNHKFYNNSLKGGTVGPDMTLL